MLSLLVLAPNHYEVDALLGSMSMYGVSSSNRKFWKIINQKEKGNETEMILLTTHKKKNPYTFLALN